MLCAIRNEKENENEDNESEGNENENENHPPHPHPHPVRAILIRPGDVLIMGGPSRLNYHAVARIVPHEAIIKYDNTIFGSDDKNENNENHKNWNSNWDTNNNAITLEQLSRLDDDDDDGTNNNNSKDTNISININDSSNSDEKKYLKRYLKDHRININVRQVYPDQN